MANEEAREAASPVQSAWDEFTHGHWGYLQGRDAFYGGFDAGVAEGIRQAREAVETVPVTQSRNAALAAIDALGEDDRG